MSPGLLGHLLRSREFRAGLAREALSFVLGVAAGLLLAATIRWLMGKPAIDFATTLILVAGFFLKWAVDITRTARAVLREHGELR